MAQVSGPLSGENFPDDVWRSIFDTTPGIVGDRDGTAFGLDLPTSTNNAALGSASQDSCAVVAGYALRIDAGDTQTVTIPESSNATNGRTDLIVARYDPGTFATAPGPVRLARIAGVEGSTSTPGYTTTASVVDLPLWAVTRKQGQSLNQAAVRDWRRWIAPTALTGSQTGLGLIPVGGRITRDGKTFRKDLASNGTTEWVQESWFDKNGVLLGDAQVPAGRVTGTPAGIRYGGTDKNIPNSTTAAGTVYDFPSGQFSYSGGVTGSSGGLVAPMTGWYTITANMRWRANGTGVRSLMIYVGSTKVADEERVASGSASAAASASALVKLDEGDVVYMRVAQTSGATLASSVEGSVPRLSMAWVGA